MRDETGHYVYIYRDARKSIQYVGYGKSHARAVFHQAGSHNTGLDALIATRKFTVEMAGPFASAEVGRAVEAALISALAPKVNVAKAEARWRFRPFGVPLRFASRLTEPELRREDFLVGRGNEPIAPVLFVRINDRTFDEEANDPITHETTFVKRKGYDPITPPTDDEILLRMDRWWQVGRFVTGVKGWMSNPESCPRTLVAIYGSPGAQLVIAAANIDRRGWHRAESEGSLWQIPTRSTKNLDAHRLRGRRVAVEARLKFGPNNNQVFMVLHPDGTVDGGSPASR